jgi:ABC-2 type transport system ATP-binding protein
MVEEKATLMRKLGTSHLTIELVQPLAAIPAELAEWKLALAANGANLIYTYDVQAVETGIGPLLRQLDRMGVQIKNLNTSHSSLEEIFVNLVHARS